MEDGRFSKRVVASCILAQQLRLELPFHPADYC